MAKKDKKNKKKKEKNKEKKVKAKASTSPIVEDATDDTKRLNRLIGQVEGIRSMLEKKRPVDEVLAQCKAAHSALRAIESRLLTTYLNSALSTLAKPGKQKNRDEQISELLELYRPVA